MVEPVQRPAGDIGDCLVTAQSPESPEPFTNLQSASGLNSKGGTGSPKQPCPLRTVTQSAAQVASQQSLILRMGIGTNTTSPSPSSNGRRRSFSATRAPGFFALLDHAERAHVSHFCVVRPCRVSSARSSCEDVILSDGLHGRRGLVAENCVWARFLPMKRPIRSRFRSIRDVELQQLGELKRELGGE